MSEIRARNRTNKLEPSLRANMDVPRPMACALDANVANNHTVKGHRALYNPTRNLALESN